MLIPEKNSEAAGAGSPPGAARDILRACDAIEAANSLEIQRLRLLIERERCAGETAPTVRTSDYVIRHRRAA